MSTAYRIASVLRVLTPLLAIFLIILLLPQTGPKNNFLLRRLAESSTSRSYVENRELLNRITWRSIFAFCALIFVWGLCVGEFIEIRPGQLFFIFADPPVNR